MVARSKFIRLRPDSEPGGKRRVLEQLLLGRLCCVLALFHLCGNSASSLFPALVLGPSLLLLHQEEDVFLMTVTRYRQICALAVCEYYILRWL